MTLNETIFKAVLAMDAYNRGYHAAAGRGARGVSIFLKISA